MLDIVDFFLTMIYCIHSLFPYDTSSRSHQDFPLTCSSCCQLWLHQGVEATLVKQWLNLKACRRGQTRGIGWPPPQLNVIIIPMFNTMLGCRNKWLPRKKLVPTICLHPISNEVFDGKTDLQTIFYQKKVCTLFTITQKVIKLHSSCCVF